MKNKNLEKIIEENFEKAMEVVELKTSEVLKNEEMEDIDEILTNVKDINTKRRILKYDDQLQRIHDIYLKLWYSQGFKDGQKFEKCKNIL